MLTKITSTVADDDTESALAVTWNRAVVLAVTSAALRVRTALVGEAIVTAGPLVCVHA